MNKAKTAKAFDEMYKDLVDPEKQAERRQLAERQKRIEDKRKDTGYE